MLAQVVSAVKRASLAGRSEKRKYSRIPSRGEHERPLEPLRAGMPGAFYIAHEAAGAPGIRHGLAWQSVRRHRWPRLARAWLRPRRRESACGSPELGLACIRGDKA